jgi:enoyl-CoA hydratase/carnithine racemase
LNSLRERLGKQLRCELHGENFGAGVELPAFAGWVIATRDTRLCLPEIALGLVPGAGGTASLPRRIGRQRTAWLALTGRAIDGQKAFEWGLIDEISA